MARLLENQTAIITGAGRGIGAATAKLFAEHGASVVVSDLDMEPSEAVAMEIRRSGGAAISVYGDVTDPAFPAQLMDAAVEKFGALHILVNNAGYTWDSVIQKTTDEQWAAIIDVHLGAPFRMIRATVPHMREAAKKETGMGLPPEPRCIINISSTSGLHGNAGQINYATAKMGIVGMTKTVAKEWGQFNIRCNAVAFGAIETRLIQPKEDGEQITVKGNVVSLGIPQHMRDMMTMMVPLGRTGTAEEAAGGVLLLASPYASYITGHTLEVTGGFGI
ncbi:MAG: SDR family NAD(P)-dependent oxidoreductase [Candidatus Hydrogenedentes bacterium]|nr:SDR family NAD(P)-dependent oxidoreductase [Candidatus Hydrogenedentota bacterium]